MSREEDRKIAILKPDYLELQREIRATKKRLQRAKLKKDNLLAEVRFLRCRLKMLKQRDSNAKLKAFGMMATNRHMESQAVDIRFESTNSATAYQENPNSQETSQEDYSSENCCHTSQIKPFAAREFQVFWEPLRRTSSTFGDAPRKSLVDKNGLVNVSKLSIYNDSSNGFATPVSGKRKISWQDQISLEV